MKKIQFLMFALVVAFGANLSFAERGFRMPDHCAVSMWAEDNTFLKTQKMVAEYVANQEEYVAEATFQETPFSPQRKVTFRFPPYGTSDFSLLIVAPKIIATVAIQDLKRSTEPQVVTDDHDPLFNYTLVCY